MTTRKCVFCDGEASLEDTDISLGRHKETHKYGQPLNRRLRRAMEKREEELGLPVRR